jgi:hypothetical protein
MDLTVYVLKDQRAACVSARQERLGLGFRVNPNPSKNPLFKIYLRNEGDQFRESMKSPKTCRRI